MSALSAIHVAKKQLGLDDDTYRAMLVTITGKNSAVALTETERGIVLDEMRRRGFKPGSKGGRKPLEGKFAKKLQALWIAGWNLGLVRNRDDAALIAFVKRQVKVDHVRFLHDAADARSAIEGLKGWLAREGGVDWTDGDLDPAWNRQPGAKVAQAQWAILQAIGVPLKPDTFRQFVEDRVFNPLPQMTAKEWALIMNMFGERIRQARHL